MPKGHEKDPSKTPAGSVPESVKATKDVSNVLFILDSHPIRTNPFGANITGESSYRRAERICAALHLITNHVPDSEPLRNRIRRGGLDLLDHILELRSGFRGLASEKGQAVLAVLRELISQARLLAIAGYVSAQNAGTICEALDELGNLIVVSQRSSLAEQLTLAHDDLIPPSTQMPEPRVSGATRNPPRKIVKDRRDRERDTMSISSGARADQIMDMLKAGGVLGIKDIAVNLPQYSEKMIQRELADLVNANRVRKVGEKRWSRYQVVQ